MNPDQHIPRHESVPGPHRQVEDLAEANERSNQTLLSLVQRLGRDAAVREKKVDLLEHNVKQTRKITIMVVIALVLLIPIGIINAININNAQHAARDSAGTFNLLLDCLNPQGECGKRSSTRSANLLEEIKRYELTVIFCARTNPAIDDEDGEEMLACVNRLYPGGPQLDLKRTAE